MSVIIDWASTNGKTDELNQWVLSEESAVAVAQWIAEQGGPEIHSGAMRRWRSAYRIRLNEASIEAPKQVKVRLNEAAPNSTLNLRTGPGIYVLTCAQNDSEVETGFLAALQGFCEVNSAQLVVLPIRYRNVSAWNAKEGPQWSGLLTDYYLNENIELSEKLALRGYTRIQATASDPLSGWSSKGLQSQVFGHGQIALKSIPSPIGYLPAYLLATGSITKPNFANAKVSEIASFHHSIAALIIEVHENDTFDVQWASWDEGDDDTPGHFFTTYGVYTASSSRPLEAGDCDDLVFGDWHGAEAPLQHLDDAFDLSDQLKPKRVWLHDAISFLSESHHLNELERIRYNYPILKTEIEDLYTDLKLFNHDGIEVWFPDSNHHRHVDRWLNQDKIRYPENARLYYLTKASCIDNPDKSPFECLFHVVTGVWINVPPRSGFQSHGIELGLHGDIGPNGSRGSVRGLSRITNKANTGHGHSCEWYKGSLRQGTCGPIDPDYAKGYNAMALVHSIIWSNGSRTLLTRAQAQVCIENGNLK